MLSVEDYKEMSEKHNNRLKIEARLSLKVCLSFVVSNGVN